MTPLADGATGGPVRGRAVVDGTASGVVLRLDEPLNVWGGLDPATGTITHRQHPQHGACVAGRVLVLPETRGSGTNAQVVAQAMANGVGPVAVVLARPDAVLVAGLIAGAELHGIVCPTALVGDDDLHALPTGTVVTVRVADGAATVGP